MANPFPGMNPYLEDPAIWPDVHQSLITYLRDELQSYIRPQYNARIGERVYLVEMPRNVYPDLTIVRRPDPPREEGDVAVAVKTESPAVDEPLVLTIPPGEHREPFLEILHGGTGEVVTVIEVLSPANKAPGAGRDLYLKKQQEILNSRAHLVEIDLLSTGLATVAIPTESYRSLPYWRYLLCVSRKPFNDKREVYTIPLSKALPRFHIPLKMPDPDVTIDLQAVLNRCYDNGGYDDFIDYQRPPHAPVTPEEQFWMNAMLEQGGDA
ncbi:MAG: DUF4058 family protein [Chloroflexi bacterium AL-W]|nr:DUF4058 family protein [Chloroflexi bacterium AL-N1]NOK66019.1 DUF4058 family protein [Chloroflexi bacterium AL-N10]NOK72900.1 DUF4058 family protein [Chloroflexi bacterium AL-N5]NOK79797.1 DUF4058 family protein [Chloroflexi bacterium AL-W]NOK88347.1 DUF4058 family protein [Chloroflexi bacterium AL-N15]